MLSQIDYAQGRTQDKVLYSVDCDGHESSIDKCDFRLTDHHGVACSSAANVAGVVCTSGKLQYSVCLLL